MIGLMKVLSWMSANYGLTLILLGVFMVLMAPWLSWGEPWKKALPLWTLMAVLWFYVSWATWWHTFPPPVPRPPQPTYHFSSKLEIKP